MGDADHTVDVNIYYGSSASSSMHISGKKVHTTIITGMSDGANRLYLACRSTAPDI